MSLPSNRRLHLYASWLLVVCLDCTGAALFAQTSREKPPASATTNPTDISAGKMIFEQRCAICHYSDSSAKKIGEGLGGLYARGKFSDGKKVDDPATTLWIENGNKDMPGFKSALKPDQIRALVAYLKTL
jgi:mono/diheme cytochrome c family protein